MVNMHSSNWTNSWHRFDQVLDVLLGSLHIAPQILESGSVQRVDARVAGSGGQRPRPGDRSTPSPGSWPHSRR